MTNGYAKWKIMVYISADGLLANFAVESLKQLKRAGGNGVVVVAEVNTDGIIPAKRYRFDKLGDSRPQWGSEKAPPLVSRHLGALQAEDLRRFIDAAVGKD